MTGADWVELLRMIPAEKQNELNIITRNGVELSVDWIMRTEPTYVVFRGRMVGNTDEGRVFFTPYNEIATLYINRFVREDEVNDLFASPAGAAETPPEARAGVLGIQESDSLFTHILGSQSAPGATQPPSSTPLLIPPASGTGSGLIPRLMTPGGVRSAGTNGPGQASVPPTPPAARAGGLTAPPAAASNGEPAPAKGTILERLRAQRGSNKSGG